jgi:adenylosuccinate lyase
VHEIIRKHSLAASQAMKEGAPGNDLLERLGADRSFGVSVGELRDIVDAHEFVGRAPEQVDDFLNHVIEPLLAGVPILEVDTELLRV